MEVLQRGYVFKSRLGLEEHFGQWHDQITTEVLCESYAAHARAKNERHPMGREALGKFMVRIGAKPVRPRHAVVGEHITDVNTGFGGTMRKAALIQGDRPHGFHLGSLAAARADFQKSTALQVDWPSDEDDAP